MAHPNFYTLVADALTETDPHVKAGLARSAAKAWAEGSLDFGQAVAPWPVPGRRDRPQLADPSTMPKRGLGSDHGRAALLHAVCHIELNAIDLALDMIGRFAPTLSSTHQSPFVSDWISVADDEARHFSMVATRLTELGSSYGDFPAHSGLWDAARRTSDDVLARLAIAPMVLEARGLDVTPGMIDRFNRVNDPGSVAVLETIYAEEVRHVAIGTKWFRRLCTEIGEKPDEMFAAMVAEHFPGGLKAPFNHPARARSDFPRDWYEGLAENDNPVRL